MKDKIFYSGLMPTNYLVMLLFWSLVCMSVQAQTYSSNGKLVDDGKAYTVPSNGDNYRDLKIPANTTRKGIYFKLKGADGGKVTPVNAYGGAGASVEIFAEIGTASGQIPPGSTLRFIVGKVGESKETYAFYRAAGAGGGTGLAFQASPEDKWQLLAVAGAGSGGIGSLSVLSAKGNPGKGIITTTLAASTGTGGTVDDTNPSFKSVIGGGGGGAFTDGVGSHFDGRTIDGGEAGWPDGPDAGEPTGGRGTGGSGWGFGGGGGVDQQNFIEVSGGGGGYRGGNCDNIENKDNAGEGGESFYNADYVKIGSATVYSQVKSPNDGNVDYQFLDILPTAQNIKLAAYPGKCVETAGSGANNYDNIQLQNCSDQTWVYEDYRFHLAKYNSKCMDVKDHGTANGTNVRIWDCMNHNEQRWIYDGVSKQLRSFLNLEKCLDSKVTSGSNIKLWDCSTTTHQEWDIAGPTTVINPTDFKYIVPVKNSAVALQSEIGAKWNSNIELSTKSDSDNSIRWIFDGPYIKYSPSKDLCLGLKDGSTSNGTNIQLMGSNSTSKTRKWVYDGYTKQIRSIANPNKCIEVNGSYAKGSNLQLNDCNGTYKQQFEVRSIEDLACINDDTPPVARCQDVHYSGLTIPTVNAIDNGSSDNCSISSKELQAGSGNTWKLVIKDSSGHTSSCTSTVTYN